MINSTSQQKSYVLHKIALLLAALVVVLWSSLVWNYIYAEKRELKDFHRQTATLAVLFAKHATATFRGVDYALLNLRNTWLRHPDELKGEVEDELKAYKDFQNVEILQIGIIDAQGWLVYSNLGLPKQPSFMGDREHFKVHQGNLQDKLFVSRPVKGRVSGKWSIQLTRPIFDKGQFAGVIVISVDPDYFVNFYEEVNLGKSDIATMVRDTGEIMVRSSDLDKYLGKIIQPSPYADPGAPLQGSFRRRSQVDGVERFYSYVRLQEYGLNVVIGSSVVEVLGLLHSQQRWLLLAASGGTLLTLFIAWQLLSTLKRKEAIQQALAESKVRLRASHNLFEKLSKHVPGMIYQYRLFADGHSTLPYVSNGIQTIYGLTPAQVRDKSSPAVAYLHPDDYDAMAASIAESARTLQVWRQEYRVNLPERGLRWLMGTAQPEKLDDGSTLWHGFISDITESKTMEAALRMTNQELEAFSYSASHDLRSPLSTIEGFSGLLAKSLAGSDNPKALHYLTRIQASAKHMARLINDLMALAQVGRKPMLQEPVDLSALANDILENLQARQPERQVALHIEAGLQTQGDAGLLRVVLENLLGNAWKYSAKQAKAEISMGQKLDKGGQPVFCVRDNGAGFDMAYANKLFQPFQRLHAEAEFEGTGVGLATVSRVIVRHGGRIWAESAPGLGAAFFFTLPTVTAGPVMAKVRPIPAFQ